LALVGGPPRCSAINLLSQGKFFEYFGQILLQTLTNLWQVQMQLFHVVKCPSCKLYGALGSIFSIIFGQFFSKMPFRLISPFSMSFPSILLNIGESNDIGNFEELSNIQATTVLSSPLLEI
jgi:hypothetical protein